MRISRLLTAVDHSAAGAQALRAGIALADCAGRASLVAVTVIPGAAAGVDSVIAEARAREEYAHLVAETAGAERAGHRMSFGVPAVELVRWAEAERADLIVLGREPGGRLERSLPGSTIAGTLRRTRVPCLVVPWRATVHCFTRIIAAVTEGPHAADVLQTARAFGELCDGELLAVHVQPRETPAGESARAVDRIAAAVAGAWGGARPAGTAATAVSPLSVRHGDVVAEILHAAAEEHADLIVVGHHRGENFGSGGAAVAARVLQRADCAILAVPV